MINELIERLLLDTENISTELDKSNSSNSINEVLNKILAYEDLTEDELNIFKSISLNKPDLTNEEKETLESLKKRYTIIAVIILSTGTEVSAACTL